MKQPPYEPSLIIQMIRSSFKIAGFPIPATFWVGYRYKDKQRSIFLVVSESDS